jgi:hypothetical protein
MGETLSGGERVSLVNGGQGENIETGYPAGEVVKHHLKFRVRSDRAAAPDRAGEKVPVHSDRIPQ